MSALEHYLSRYPNGPHAVEARASIDEARAAERAAHIEAEWTATAGTNTIPAYEAFAERYPEAPQVDDARDRVLELRWSAVRERHDPDEYRAFLSEFPDDPHAAEARTWIGSSTFESIRWQVGDISLRGRFKDGYVAEVLSVEFTEMARVDGQVARVSVAIEAKNGHMDRDPKSATLICPNDVELSVSGSVTYVDGAGTEVRVPFTDVYLPSDRNVLSGWLVTEDLRFGRTDVERLANEIPRLRRSQVDSTVDIDAPRTLFAISTSGLRPIR